MKNKKAKKTYSSTKKKTSNAKIAVTVLLVFVLLAGAIVGTLAAISDGFTKPVEDWFSDKATVTPGDQTGDEQGDQTTPGGNDQDDQTGDDEPEEPAICNHTYVYGKCSLCGACVSDVISMPSRIASSGEDVVVNFYTPEYELIETKTVKAGESIPLIDGYQSYAYLTEAKFTVKDIPDTEEVYYYLGGTLCLSAGDESVSSFLSQYHIRVEILDDKLDYLVYHYIPDGISYSVNGVSQTCYSNGRKTYEARIQSDGIHFTYPIGTEIEFYGISSSANFYIKDGLVYHLLSSFSYIPNIACVNIQNYVVLDYDNSEVA